MMLAFSLRGALKLTTNNNQNTTKKPTKHQQRPQAGEPAAGLAPQRQDRRLWAVQRDARRPLPQDELRQPQLRGARGV